jgi:hypothetical protein
MKTALAAGLVAATATMAAIPALAATPVLPEASVFAVVAACTTTPCQNDFSQSAVSNVVPLSQFGKNYTVTNVNEGHNPPVYQTTQNTPGELAVGDVHTQEYSVAKANGSPKVSSAASIMTGAGSTTTASDLTYYFEVIPDLGQGALTPVNVGVTAKGAVTGSSTSPPSTFASSNGGNATAQLVIGNFLNEIAQADYGYRCVLSDNDCSQTFNDSTSNVTVKLGPTSTFSGGFDLNNAQFSLLTDHPYEVQLNTQVVVGAYPGSSVAWVDPMITVPVGYSLDLSPGIDFAAGVPEPATWATMLLGLGLVGGLARRRRAAALEAV